MDVAKEARMKGLFSLINTNGYIEEEAAKDILSSVQVAKVDIKGFSDQCYREICQGHLDPVLRTCRLALRSKVHLELSYLLVPGWTDSPELLARFADWVGNELRRDVPLHLYQFHPSFRMGDVPEESLERMRQVRQQMHDAGLHHVYLGGTKEDEGKDTLCSRCGEVIVSRGQSTGEKVIVDSQEVSRFCPSFSIVRDRSIEGKCPRCGNPTKIVFWGRP
jgi:pyruvate formate lyase activating enzyme